MAVMILAKRFRVRCEKCLLELEYEAADVAMKKDGGPYITCPTCGNLVPHRIENEVPPEEPAPEKPRPKVDPGNPYANN